MANAKRTNKKPQARTSAAAARSGNPAVRAGAVPASSGSKGASGAKTGATPKVSGSSRPGTGATPAVPKGPAIKPRLGHAHALTTGDKAPSFTLKTSDGEKISLNAMRKDVKRGLVIFFMPNISGKTSVVEANEFRDAHAKLVGAGYQVLAITPDNPQDLAKAKAANKLPFPLASDPASKVARKFGAYGKTHRYAVTATMPDQFHRAVPKAEGPLRSTFVIDDVGRISQVVPSVQAKGHVGRLMKRLGLVSS